MKKLTFAALAIALGLGPARALEPGVTPALFEQTAVPGDTS